MCFSESLHALLYLEHGAKCLVKGDIGGGTLMKILMSTLLKIIRGCLDKNSQCPWVCQYLMWNFFENNYARFSTLDNGTELIYHLCWESHNWSFIWFLIRTGYKVTPLLQHNWKKLSKHLGCLPTELTDINTESGRFHYINVFNNYCKKPSETTSGQVVLVILDTMVS